MGIDLSEIDRGVDPSYRDLFIDTQGHALTEKDLQEAFDLIKSEPLMECLSGFCSNIESEDEESQEELFENIKREVIW